MHNTVFRASRRLAVNLASTKVITRKFASTHVAQKSSKVALVGAAALVAGVAGTVYLNSNTVFAAGQAGSPEEEKLRASFLKHASSDINGEKFMTPDDFLTALGSAQEGRATIDRDKFLILFRMADSNKNGLISFDEFVQFENLMTRSDAEYLLAFKLFDRDNNGFISKEDFKQVAATEFLDSAVPFDFNCELMRLYFGKGTHELSYNQFTQLLKDIQQERVKQEFMFYDKKGSGYIPADKFVQIINSVKLRKIPEHVKQRLETIADMNANTKHEGFVSYAQFVACNDMLLHIPSYARVLLAAENSGRKMSSKDDFLRVAQDTTSVEITPMEVDLIFHLFDTDKDGMLSYSGYNNLVKSFNQAKAPVSAAPIPAHHTTASEKIIETIQNFGLGSVAGAVGATAVYPIDLVKTRMQNQRAVRVEDRVYKNSWDCFRKVLANEGFTGLYRGLGPQCVGVAPEKAIKLTVNSLLRDLFEDKSKGEIYFPLEVLAGGSAGASQVLFTNPLEIVKIRLQVQGEGGVRAGAGTIIRELGLTGLYKGAGACLLRDIPFSAIYFPTYAKMKNVLADEKGFTGPWELLLAGAVAGIPAASLVTPADVIKTRLQVKAKQGEQTYTGIRDCAVKVWKAEGFRAFFKGCLARVFRSSPQFGVTLWTYEQLQRNLFPHITPKPPTNAPVTQKDFQALRPSTMQRVEKAEQKFGLRKDKPQDKKENKEKNN